MIETAVKKDFTAFYLPADRYLEVNEKDERLHTIKIALPDPPLPELIDGYGLDPKKQFWKPPEYPRRLKALERTCDTIDEIWEKLNLYKDTYEKEWEFIEKEWDRRNHGYWLYINGKPTYMDGWHYTYCGYNKLDIGLPEYRSRDRKFFIFGRYCYTTTEAYFPSRITLKGHVVQYFQNYKEAKKFKIKSKNEELKIEQDGYLIDMGVRTVYGFNYPKHRREGATYKANEINFLIASASASAITGIQSMDGPSARKAFDKAVVKPWKKYPFFFQPRYDGNTNPKTTLYFDVPAINIGGKGSLANIDTGLETTVTYANTANRGWYDGDKLAFLNNDEIGKTLLEDVNQRWGVQKKCLAQGNGRFIHGLAINTSTVGEMSEKGGGAFKRLCDLSHYEQRNKSGQTTSGLLNLFIPADDGLEGFIDIFGESVMENPKESDLWRIPEPSYDVNGKIIGAIEYLQNARTDLLLRDDQESMIEYEEEIRLHPVSFNECFITAGSGSGLNLKKITKRIRELLDDPTATQRGNFKWRNNERDTWVIWEPDEINGRFLISYILDDSETNQKHKVTIIDGEGGEKEVWAPKKFWRFTSSSDSYKFNKVEGNRLSKGGGSTFMERDIVTDPDEKDIKEWQTYRFICTYTYRPLEKEDYAEDMLMMCIYYGSLMFPEINIPLVWDWFVTRGYDGFLKYWIDPNGKMNKTPGMNLLKKSAQRVMQAQQSHIENHCEREQHIDYLLDCKALRGVEDITNHDLYASTGVNLIGVESSYDKFRKFYDDDSKGGDVSDYF